MLKRQDGERISCWKRKLFSYLPATEILEEKIQGSSPQHSGGHDAEERDGEDLLRAAQLRARAEAAVHAAGLVGRAGALQTPSRLAYLHDDVKGQVEQQVTDEDAQHVGCEVPGPVDQSKEGAVHMGKNYFAAMRVDMLNIIDFFAFPVSFLRGGEFKKKKNTSL